MKLLPSITLALCLSAGAYDSRADDTALSPDNLAGRWVPTQLSNGRGRDRSTIRRNLPKVFYDFVKVGDGQYRADKSWRTGSGETTRTQLIIRERRSGFSLKLTSNRASLRKDFPAYSIEPKRSKNGVDIMTNVTTPTTSDSFYFVRFRDTVAAREAGIEQLDYAAFCSGPAQQLAEGAEVERKALEDLGSTAGAFGLRHASHLGLALGLFANDGVKLVTGSTFIELSDAARSTLIERLRTCAIYHQDRDVADTIAEALFGNQFTIKGVLGDVGRLFQRNPPLESMRTASSVEADLRAADAARKSLVSARKSLDALGGDALLDARRDMLKEHGYKLPPSEIFSELAMVSASLKERDSRRATAREEELDKTGPAQSENKLILSATQKYLLEDCSRSALALRDKNGQSLPSLALARSVKPQEGLCVIDLTTHVFSFNIRRVESEQCGTRDPVACRFDAYWFCSYELNPSFGFSSNTPNIDFICPLIRSVPVQMQGTFDRKSQRRWIANQVNW